MVCTDRIGIAIPTEICRRFVLVVVVVFVVLDDIVVGSRRGGSEIEGVAKVTGIIA